MDLKGLKDPRGLVIIITTIITTRLLTRLLL